jgi:hypothetical protein
MAAFPNAGFCKKNPYLILSYPPHVFPTAGTDQRIVAGSQRTIWGKNIIRMVVMTMAIINTLVPV